MKIILYLLFLIASTTAAQNASLKGIVLDRATAKPLHDVELSIERAGRLARTNEHGEFFLQNLEQGLYEVHFSKLSYEKEIFQIEISRHDTIQINVELGFKKTDLNPVEITADRPVSAASSKYLSRISSENKSKNSVQDMLRLVPGMFIAQHAGGGKAEQIFVRGFDCDHGTDVAIFADGIPVNMPSHGHGQGYADIHFIIPETVEGMEIFKGPYFPRYGNFATGAAVQFKTLDSPENNIIKFETAFVPNKKNITGTRGVALLKIPNTGSRISSYISVDGINKRGYFDASQDLGRINIFSKTSFTVNDHSQLQFSTSGFRSSWNASGQIPQRAVKEGTISRFGSINDNESGTTLRDNLNFVYRLRLKASELYAQTYASDYRFKLYSDFTFFLNDPVNGDAIEQSDSRTIRGLNAHYSISHLLGSMNNRLTLGTSIRLDEIENQLWHVANRMRLKARANALIKENAIGFYASEVFRFSDQLRIEIGGRFDYFIFHVEDLLPADSSHKNYSGYNFQTLVSPKFNLIYTPTERLQLFLNAGVGFHSNDARSVVQDPGQHRLPRAPGVEIGTLFQFSDRLVASIACWWLELENELVFVGDEGTTEDQGSSRRMGVDFNARYNLTSFLTADVDVNISRSRFTNRVYGNELPIESYIPLSPALTSSGGLTAKFKKAFETELRYRFMTDRPANETSSVYALGYTLIDFSMSYQLMNYKIGLVIENLFDAEWNEAQFDTESRLKNELSPVKELHYTPGTPLAARFTIGYQF